MKCDLGFVALIEASELTEIVVLTAGEVEFSHGGPLHVDAKAAEKIIAAFKAQGVQLPIDYEHSTIVKGEKGEKAPAAGWITAMHWEPDRGLIASVDWTAEARSYIETTEYKYLSPVLLINVKTRSPYKLHSMALTNKPATKHQMEMLAASARLLEETLPMATKQTEASDKKDVKKKGVIIAQDDGGEGEGETAPLQDTLAVLIGELAGWLKADGVAIEEGASLEAIIKAAIEDRRGAGGGEGEPTAEEIAARDSVLKVLGAKDGNEAILKLKADFVPRADHKLLSARLAELEGRDNDREVELVIARMVDENKINPNDEEQLKACRAYAKTDLAAFTAFMASQPAYMEPGRAVAPMSGKASATGNRRGLIIQACAEYNGGGKAFQRLTTLPAFVAQELSEQGQSALTEDEVKAL